MVCTDPQYRYRVRIQHDSVYPSTTTVFPSFLIICNCSLLVFCLDHSFVFRSSIAFFTLSADRASRARVHGSVGGREDPPPPGAQF